MSYRLVIFDWDGTLVNSAGVIATCFQRAARDTGLPVPDTRAVQRVIGLGLEEAFDMLFPGRQNKALMEAAMTKYRQHFRAATPPARLFAGVAAGLERLRAGGIRLAVATGKSRRGLDRALRETGLTDHFAATCCADEAPSKPHPQMVRQLLEKTGVAPPAAIVVGDTTYDMEMAGRAGVAALGVSYGVHEAPELLARGARVCLASFVEAHSWLIEKSA